MHLVHRGGSIYKGGGVWPFGPTDKSFASLGRSTSGDVPADSSGLFGAFSSITGEETESAFFRVEEGSIRGLGLRDRITGGLASMIRALAIMTMIDYLWLSFGSSFNFRVVSKTTPDMFGWHHPLGGRVSSHGRSSRGTVKRRK